MWRVSTKNDSDVSPRGASAATRSLLFLIDGYRLILSPILGGHCRYVPSCSRYAQEALECYGAWRGVRLAAGRILRCHPFSPGGFDPVP